MDIVNTHLNVTRELVGMPLSVTSGIASTVELIATPQMAVDESGLTHGGFTFGLADYAAMLAVNQPNVVLGGSQCRFTAPVRSGERMRAEARVTENSGKKNVVSVDVSVGEKKVFSGTFICYTLEKHVLSE